MLDPELFALDVKHMVAAGYSLAVLILFLAGKAVGKLTAIIGDQLDDLDRTGRLHFRQEVNTAVIRLVGIDFHVDPASCTIDGDEQISSRCFVRHLR